ncbi:allergen MAG29-like [Heterodontus francisci]|uniref:allergen MAG29-like n=1 Tax=Heterodontus francisci TaxID=7792 RepID=UPI00355B7884
MIGDLNYASIIVNQCDCCDCMDQGVQHSNYFTFRFPTCDLKVKDDKIKHSQHEFVKWGLSMGATDQMLEGHPCKVGDDDKQKILDKCNEVISWLDKNQTAEKDEYEHQQKEVEKICNPIITKLYQGAGGPPGGFPGAGSAPSGAGAASGPTIEEVD